MKHQLAFPPSRAAGLARMADFAPRMGTRYASGRNSDPGPGRRVAVSELSPYIRHRLVTETEILTTALTAHGAERAEKFIQELFWRTYWKGWLALRPAIWDRYRAGLDQAEALLATDRRLAKQVARAMAGDTGIAGFDDWAQELLETGYLHNHARMWFASIWIFTLRLPWELGAAHFRRHLLDGDPASNTLSWRWVAGLHTPGKIYLARRDNIRDHSFGRFDPDGLVEQAAALTEDPVPAPLRLTLQATPVDARPAGLLLHGDDMVAHELDLPCPPEALATVMTDDGRCGEVQAWVRLALADGAAQAGRRFGLTPSLLDAADGFPVASIVDWARKEKLGQVLTPAATVGPVQEMLRVTELALARHGIRLVPVPRPYDLLCWPHATKGFFAFKTQIPSLLATLTTA